MISLNYLRPLVFFLTLTFSFFRAQGNNGAQLDYTWIGQDSYIVRLIVYQSCNGNTPLAAQKAINANSSSACGPQTSYLLPLVNSFLDTSSCSGFLNQCNGGTAPGMQIGIYSDTIILPATCSDWVLSHSACCRNASITNLNNPGSNSLHVTSSLNSTLQNSSPRFDSTYKLVHCWGAWDSLSFGTWEPDGDSVVYAWANPQTSNGASMGYNPPGSATNPLNGPETIHPDTGMIRFSASLGVEQLVVFAITVFEYRNGQLISHSVRDIAIHIIDCSHCGALNDTIQGTVYYDLNANCQRDLGEPPVPYAMVEAKPGPYYAISDTNGNYQIYVVPGTYTDTCHNPYQSVVSVICPAPALAYQVTFATGGLFSGGNDFGVQGVSGCPQNFVILNSNGFVPCSTSTIFVN